MPTLQFWYEFASTYSYPAAMRIEALAAARGGTVSWRPFLLGPLFAGQGWRDSPFNLYPVKGHYMWRDMQRLCDALQLPLRRPDPFPQNSLLAARVATALPDETRPAFSRAVYDAQFGRGLVISDRAVIAKLLADLGHDAETTLTSAESPENKAALKAAVAQALALGLPGAPCVVTPTARCSGATTGWRRRRTGRRAAPFKITPRFPYRRPVAAEDLDVRIVDRKCIVLKRPPGPSMEDASTPSNGCRTRHSVAQAASATLLKQLSPRRPSHRIYTDQSPSARPCLTH